MATPSLIDLESLLVPIAGDCPSGRNLAYEPEFDELREARRSEDDTLQGDWQRRAKVADWESVIELGTGLLRRETKDLQIAVWIAEALTKRHGFAGLRDGLRLVRGLQDTFWNDYHPQIEDGDKESRLGPFLFLNNVLPLTIRSIPLTAGLGQEQYSFLRWQESRATDNVGLKDAELMEKLIGEGKITSQQFDQEAAQTPRSFFETIVEDLHQAIAAMKELDQQNDAQFGRDAPSLVSLRKALEDCRKPLEPLLATKRAEEPDVDPEPDPEAQEPAATEEEPESESHEAQPRATSRRRGPASTRSSGGPIASVEDAQLRIVEATAYLRQNDPSSPVPFLVVRALRMGDVYAMSQPPDASQCEAPSSEVRQALRRLAAEGEWGELLEQAEQALGRPEGRAWLDPHRYALAAMAALSDPDRSAASASVRTLLRAFLDDVPGLVEAELADGTPTANAETRAWLRDEILTPAPAPPAEPKPEPESYTYEPPPREPAPEPAGSATEAPPDVWEEAVELVRRRLVAEGLQLIRRAMQAASTGRERFLRKLQLAELCLMVNKHRVALPLSEDLARHVDEFHLEHWEDEQLSARVWSVLYRCLRQSAETDNGAADRLQQVFTRLCRLDINQALMYGEDRSQG